MVFQLCPSSTLKKQKKARNQKSETPRNCRNDNMGGWASFSQPEFFHDCAEAHYAYAQHVSAASAATYKFHICPRASPRAARSNILIYIDMHIIFIDINIYFLNILTYWHVCPRASPRAARSDPPTDVTAPLSRKSRRGSLSLF